MADASKTMKAVREALGSDRTANDYFVRAPLVIDCSDDATEFTASITHDQRQTMVDRYLRGDLQYVSGLYGNGKDYALRKLRERYSLLDRQTTSQLERLLSDWRSERDRLSGQLSKPPGNFDGGVEIILPLQGIRLKCDPAFLANV